MVNAAAMQLLGPTGNKAAESRPGDGLPPGEMVGAAEAAVLNPDPNSHPAAAASGLPLARDEQPAGPSADESGAGLDGAALSAAPDVDAKVRYILAHAFAQWASRAAADEATFAALAVDRDALVRILGEREVASFLRLTLVF